MYLSRITLDVHHPSVRQALRDCGDMHRNLMQAFAQTQIAEQPRRNLGLVYRAVNRKDEISLLVLSQIPPDGDILRRNGYTLDARSPKDISALEQVFKEGMTLRFELLASPCKKVDGEGKNSRRVFLKTADERAQWLNRQGEKNGFMIESALEDGAALSIDGGRQGMRIHFDAVRFTGTLRVTDSALFWQGYSQGIGPGKAYGLGMLTVAKA